MRLIELTVAWQNSKPVSYISKMQLVSHCYTAVLYQPISRLYICIYENSAVYLFDARVTCLFVFCVCVLFVCFFVCLFFVFLFCFFYLFIFFFFFFFFFFFLL